MPAKVSISNNGPIRIEGEFSVVDASGTPYDLAGRTVIGLCRCGLSMNKPFCDGTHGKQGFSSECTAFALPAPKPKV